MRGACCISSASDGVSGFELWKIEAGRSVPGTGLLPRPQLVKDIYPGPGHGGASPFAFAGSTLFFGAQDPEHGLELWKSDGTAEGTVLVKDILPGPESSIPFRIVPFGDRVLFTTYLYDDEARSGLWISDGTEAGTLRLGSPPFVSNIIAAGHRAFFLSFTDETGWEWGVTDGTVAGTHIIDARPGPEGLGDSVLVRRPREQPDLLAYRRLSAGNLPSSRGSATARSRAPGS